MKRKLVPRFTPLLCPLFVTLSGCLPIPHRERDFPETTGVLTVNGAPLGNLPVAAVILPPATSGTALAHVCRAASPLVRLPSRTDAQGRFHFAEHRHWTALTSLIGDRWESGWALCALAPATGHNAGHQGAPPRPDSTSGPGAWRLVYAAANSGALGGQRKQYACDIRAPLDDEWDTRYGRIGQCRLVLPPEPRPFTHPLPPVMIKSSSVADGWRTQARHD